MVLLRHARDRFTMGRLQGSIKPAGSRNGKGAGRMSGTAILNREQLDKLERRELQLTVLSVVFVLVLAGGLAAFMYPLVFVHPDGNKWTLRVAFFGFCTLVALFIGYFLDR